MFWFLSLTLDEWIFAIGGLIFILLGKLLVQALAPKQSGAIGFITTILTAVPRTLILFTQKIVATFAPVTLKPQARIAAGLHAVAQLVDDAAGVIKQQSAIIATLAQAIAGTATASDLRGIEAGLTKRVGNAEAQARGIGADVLPRIKAAEGAISADVLPKIASLDAELNRTLHKDLPRINARVNSAEGSIGHLWSWVRAHTVDVAAIAFAGAVAVALGRLGGGWIRCRNWNRLGKSVCSLPFQLLEELLSAAIDVLLIADVCQITKVMIGVAESSIVQDALRGIITGVDELMLCQGVDLPAPLGGYAAGLPPAQAFSALPAA